MIGLIGKKLGQTRVYDDAGNAVSVTIVLAGPNRVLQCKTADTKDGYSAVQLGFDDQKIDGRATQPMRGYFKKAGTPVVKFVREFRNFSLEVKLGDEVGHAGAALPPVRTHTGVAGPGLWKIFVKF